MGQAPSVMPFALRILGAAALCCAPVRGQDARPSAPAKPGSRLVIKRSATFEIIQNSALRAVVFPFATENIGALRSPSHPASRLLAQVTGQALGDYAKAQKHPAATDLDVAVAVTDWVARTLRHPSFYPRPSEGIDPYPPESSAALTAVGNDAFKVLTLVLAADPRDAAHWPSPLCGQQNAVAALMLNYLGIYARLVNPQNHTGLEIYSRQLGKWVWCESTFNEHYVVQQPSGALLPLSAREIQLAILAGNTSSLHAVKHGFPDTIYLNILPEGFRRYGVELNMLLTGPRPENLLGWDRILISGDRPIVQEDSQWVPGKPNPFPLPPWWFNPQVADPAILDDSPFALGLSHPPAADVEGLEVRLSTRLPYCSSLEIRKAADKEWAAIEEITSPGFGQVDFRPIRLGWSDGLVRIRAKDSHQGSSTEFIINLFP